jgi:hypothetical protein
VKGIPILEKILKIHGVIHFWIAPNPKEGGELINCSHQKKDMVEIPTKTIRFQF